MGRNRKKVGDIIVLNGASSSGKSTLSRAIQARIDEPFIHFSFDHLRDSLALPMDRIKRKEFDWKEMRSQVFDGVHRVVEALAAAGNNVVFEHILEKADWHSDLQRRFKPFQTLWIGVFCPLEELEKREKARGNRKIGEGKNDLKTVHTFCEYDLEIDSTRDAKQNAQLVIELWRERNLDCKEHRK